MALTEEELEDANNAVIRRLNKLGLSDVAVRTTVKLTTDMQLHRAHCLCDTYPDIEVSTRFHILNALVSPLGFGSAGTTLEDVLAHEYGHAAAAVRGWTKRKAKGFGVEPFVSTYAETDWEEDVCETLMFTIMRWRVPADKSKALKALLSLPCPPDPGIHRYWKKACHRAPPPDKLIKRRRLCAASPDHPTTRKSP